MHNIAQEKILSISIAAYNVEKTLRETLDPFLKISDIDKLDIMIIDDGSTDGTAQIAREYVEKCPSSFKLVQKENGGWGSTLNTGIKEAVGVFFKQLDGDDHYEPENISDFLNTLENTQADAVISKYIEYDDGTGTILKTIDCNPNVEYGKVYAMTDIPPFSPFMHSFCIRTDLLRKSRMQITEKCFYTDTEFVLKSLNLISTVQFFEKVIYCYRRASSGQSMSLMGLEKHCMEQQLVIEKLLNYRNTAVNRSEIRKIYDDLLYGTCTWHYMCLLYCEPTLKRKKQFIAYDRLLKNNAHDYYDRISLKSVIYLRKMHFLGYSFIARAQKKRDRRFDKDGRMLY